MNPQVKQAWLAALRSGEYVQGKGALHKGDTFCCLGVLCDLHRKEVGGDWWRPSPRDACHYFGQSDLPPTEVVQWAGLEDAQVTVADQGLAHLNDAGRPFTVIASLIERHL